MVSVEIIESHLANRLGRFNIEPSVITQVAKEIGNICGAEPSKRYRVEYVAEGGGIDTTTINAANDVDVYKAFYAKPEFKKCTYLKCVLIE